MRRIAAPAALALALAACSPTDLALMTGDHDAMFDMMAGTGAVSRAPDGTDTFRWVVRTDAYDSVAPADDHEAVREQMLAQWLGAQQACPDGYEITSQSEAMDILIYEGRCL